MKKALHHKIQGFLLFIPKWYLCLFINDYFLYSMAVAAV